MQLPGVCAALSVGARFNMSQDNPSGISVAKVDSLRLRWFCIVVNRYTRLEYAQAEDTIKQLLRELMLLREIISSLQSSANRASDSAACNGNLESSTALATSHASSSSSQALSNKRISRSKLLGELNHLRQAKAAVESKHVDLLQRLGALEAEKERAEECSEMISRETAKLLDDKRQLLNDLGKFTSLVHAPIEREVVVTIMSNCRYDGVQHTEGCVC